MVAHRPIADRPRCPGHLRGRRYSNCSAGGTFASVSQFTFVGEVALTLWLLVKGVDVERWRQRGAGREEADLPAG